MWPRLLAFISIFLLFYLFLSFVALFSVLTWFIIIYVLLFIYILRIFHSTMLSVRTYLQAYFFLPQKLLIMLIISHNAA